MRICNRFTNHNNIPKCMRSWDVHMFTRVYGLLLECITMLAEHDKRLIRCCNRTNQTYVHWCLRTASITRSLSQSARNSRMEVACNAHSSEWKYLRNRGTHVGSMYYALYDHGIVCTAVVHASQTVRSVGLLSRNLHVLSCSDSAHL